MLWFLKPVRLTARALFSWWSRPTCCGLVGTPYGEIISICYTISPKPDLKLHAAASWLLSIEHLAGDSLYRIWASTYPVTGAYIKQPRQGILEMIFIHFIWQGFLINVKGYVHLPGFRLVVFHSSFKWSKKMRSYRTNDIISMNWHDFLHPHIHIPLTEVNRNTTESHDIAHFTQQNHQNCLSMKYFTSLLSYLYMYGLSQIHRACFDWKWQTFHFTAISTR